MRNLTKKPRKITKTRRKKNKNKNKEEQRK